MKKVTYLGVVCPHGLIGACVECDGCGQEPVPGDCAHCGANAAFTVEWLLPGRRGDMRLVCSYRCVLALTVEKSGRS